MKTLSKSTGLIFIFDLIVLILSSIILCCYFSLSVKTTILVSLLIIFIGLFSLFLKDNYKIREFNITIWNKYRLFEASVFTHIPIAVLLFFFVPKRTLCEFLLVNVLTVFVGLYLYRLGLDYYLFNLKKVKKVLIIGANDRAKAIAEVILNKQPYKWKCLGLLNQQKSKRFWLNYLLKHSILI